MYVPLSAEKETGQFFSLRAESFVTNFAARIGV